MNRLRNLFLLPVSWLYGAIVGIRNACYDLQMARTVHVAVPVISVGNITVGGTGKTPFVEYLMTFLQQKRIALVSRGYKRTSRGTVIVSNGKERTAGVDAAGDEPFQIARKFPLAAVIVDERKARGARFAVEQFHPDVILVDDGFQHRSLGRTLDIVMLDGRLPLKETALLPLGRRREQLSSLRRADAVVISGTTGVSGDRSDVREYSDAPQFRIRFKPVSLCNIVTGEKIAVESVSGKSVVAFCGVGNPVSFRQTLDEVGVKVASWMTFPDHYRYSESDLEILRSERENLKADFIVTTEKDAVRLLPLSSMQAVTAPLFYYIDIEVVVAGGEAELQALIRSALDGDTAGDTPGETPGETR